MCLNDVLAKPAPQHKYVNDICKVFIMILIKATSIALGARLAISHVGVGYQPTRTPSAQQGFGTCRFVPW